MCMSEASTRPEEDFEHLPLSLTLVLSLAELEGVTARLAGL